MIVTCCSHSGHVVIISTLQQSTITARWCSEVSLPQIFQILREQRPKSEGAPRLDFAPRQRTLSHPQAYREFSSEGARHTARLFTLQSRPGSVRFFPVPKNQKQAQGNSLFETR